MIENLRGGYGKHELFHDFSLCVRKGSFTCIVGPNGSGKSTLFRFILKAMKPEAGKILIAGEDTREMSQLELAGRLAFIPQYYLMPEGFSVAEICRMTDYAHPECTDEELEQALQTAGILYLKDKMGSEISGGEAQMVMLSRAVCCRTELILMDEPTNNLDINHQTQLLQSAGALCAREGKSILCAMHDLNSALKYTDYCYVINHGSLYAEGRPDEVINGKMLKEVFHSDARIIEDPDTGSKVILP